MTVTLIGTGGCFTRVGRMGGALNDTNTFRGTTLVTKADNIRAQFASTNQQLVDDLYRQLNTNPSASLRWKSTRLNSSHIQKSRMPSSA